MTDAERIRDLELVVALFVRQGVVFTSATAVEVEALRRVGDRALRAKDA